MKASTLCVQKHFEGWFGINFAGKSSGRVFLRCDWLPDNQANMAYEAINQEGSLALTIVDATLFRAGKIEHSFSGK